MQSAVSSRNQLPAAPWYTHRWPWLLMLGPFLVVVAATFTGWLAFSRQDALVVDDYYKQGKAINQDLRRDRMAASLQLKFNAHYDPAAGKLIGSMAGANQALAGKIKLRLVHSTQPEKDINRDVQLDRHGNFAVDLAMLEQARWQVLVEDEARNWRLTGEWSWPKEQAVVLRADMEPADG